MERDDQGRPNVVETASATTDANNSRSGGFAYGIAVLAIAVSALLGIGLQGIIRSAGDLASSALGQQLGTPDSTLGPDSTNQDLENWLLEEWGDGGESDDQVSDTDSSTAQKIEDLVSLDLAMFSYTIDAHLSASVYANSQQSISAYVRELVVTDRNASSDIATLLHTAAWGSGSLDDALATAQEKASETLETLRAMKAPEAQGEHATTIAESLETGREAAISRWEAIATELDLLARSESLSQDDIKSNEQDIADATDKAAEQLAAALKDSADR